MGRSQEEIDDEERREWKDGILAQLEKIEIEVHGVGNAVEHMDHNIDKRVDTSQYLLKEALMQLQDIAKSLRILANRGPAS